jgi:hypothetical protein
MSLQGERGIDGVEPRASAVCLKTGLVTLILALACHPLSLQACAACYGQSDAPMAKGMNWGIFSLLGVVAVVLGSIIAFFIYLARRARLNSLLVATANGVTASGAGVTTARIGGFQDHSRWEQGDGLPIWHPATRPTREPALLDSPEPIL